MRNAQSSSSSRFDSSSPSDARLAAAAPDEASIERAARAAERSPTRSGRLLPGNRNGSTLWSAAIRKPDMAVLKRERAKAGEVKARLRIGFSGQGRLYHLAAQRGGFAAARRGSCSGAEPDLQHEHG